MYELKNKKEWEQFDRDRSQCKVYCKCGHSMYIPMFKEYMICDWCGTKVYNNKINQTVERIKKFKEMKLC